MKPVRPVLPSASRPARSRRLLILLGAAAALFFVSLPWQMRNWAETARFNEEARVREARIRSLRQQGGASPAAPDSLAGRIQAAAALAGRAARSGDGAAAAEAARAVRKLEGEAARSPQVADRLAELYQQTGHLDRALAMARLSLRLAPDAPGPLLRLGYLEIALGRPESGAAYFRRAVRAGKAAGMAEPHVALALAYDLGGAYPSAEQELRTARRLQPANWRTALLLSQNLVVQRRYEEAGAALADALRLAPDEPQPHVEQAAFLLKRAEDGGGADTATAARRAAERALLLDPHNLDARFLLGRIHADAGADADALREWEAVFAVRPAYRKLRVNMGRLLLRTGDKERGRRLLREGEREEAGAAEFNRLVIRAGSDPENMPLRRELARWCMRHGKLSRAILEWEEILARLPEDPEARRQLSVAQARRGDS